jgi:hypothetical protein
MSDKVVELMNMLSPEEQTMVLEQVREYDNALLREEGQTDFMKFVTTMWPGFIHGRHHALMARKFEEIAEGKTKRLSLICLHVILSPSLHRLCCLHGS